MSEKQRVEPTIGEINHRVAKLEVQMYELTRRLDRIEELLMRSQLVSAPSTENRQDQTLALEATAQLARDTRQGLEMAQKSFGELFQREATNQDPTKSLSQTNERELLLIEISETKQKPTAGANFSKDEGEEDTKLSFKPPSTPSWLEFDVFLSFRGEDTRKGFTDHLFTALKGSGIRTFRDDEELERGDKISESLLQAIRGSAIAIPVFSKSYADSSWCLMELAHILECRLFILPIFYDVDPSEVRHQKGAFEETFKKHEKRFGRDTVDKWREALKKAAETAGYDLKNVANGHESKLIQLVIEKVQREVNNVRPRLLPTPKTEGKAATVHLRSIMDHLKDPNVHKIGVWGMGGVGKTCLVLNVHNELQEASAKLFEHIIFVKVPCEEGSSSHVRNQIRRQLLIHNLTDEVDELAAAALLNKRLVGRKFLLILDDLWKSVDLQALGVPEPNQENGCKILFTTRNFRVCNSMGIQANVKVEPLPPQEAWGFFCKRVGEIPHGIESTAKDIVEFCGGLPPGLAAMAEYLRNERNTSLWYNARRELFESKPLSHMEQVFGCLRVSYDRLESQALKDFFMACVFYSDRVEHHRNRLLVNVIVEGPNQLQTDKTLRRERVVGGKQLNILREACLLEDCSRDQGETHVRVHELIRSMALHMKSGRFITHHGRGVEYAPSDNAWEAAERISLRRTSIKKLPSSPCCPHLISLLLIRSDYLEGIPVTFFDHMEALRVLDLSYTKVTHLPPSLSKLVNLQHLTLAFCPLLSTIDGVEKLTKLIELDLTVTAIEELPLEISNLSKLKLIRLRGTTHLRGIPSGVISKLFYLEELYMDGSAYAWTVEGTITEASLQELHCLPRLNRLDIRVASERDYEYIKQATTQKWRNFAKLNCYIHGNNKYMEFDRITKMWATKTEMADPMLQYSEEHLDV